MAIDRRRLAAGFLVRLVALGLVVLSSAQAGAQDAIRLGWQIPWSTQGQLVQALKHSNIPDLTGISLHYIGFAYGGPLNRAALSGEADVLLTGDQPAVVLLSKGKGYKIVARMMYNRVCLYVPPKSEIVALGDFKSKKLVGPIGAAAERVSIAALKEAGVLAQDIELGQLEMEQQAAQIRGAKPDDRTWGTVDGMFGFDPLPTIWKTAGLVKLVSCGKVVSVVVASKEMQTTRKPELEAFLKAFKLAWDQYRQKPNKYGQMFLDEAQIVTGFETLDEAASIEPNRWAASFGEINMTLNESDLKVIKDTRDFLVGRKIVPADFDLAEGIDMSFVTEALADADLPGLAERVK